MGAPTPASGYWRTAPNSVGSAGTPGCRPFALLPSCLMHHATFFQVVAEVIPILFLALLLQMEYFKPAAEGDGINLFVLSLVIFAAVGEIISLSALLDNRDPSRIEQTAAVGAVTVLFLPLLVRAARPIIRGIDEGSAARIVIRAAGVIFLVGMVVLGFLGEHLFGPFLAIFAFGFFLVASVFGRSIEQHQRDTKDDP